MNPACRTKVHYDTEFEAVLAANRVEYKYGEEMEPYRCGNHWHITHVNVEQRRGVGHLHWRCPKCKSIMRQINAAKHKCVIKGLV